MAYSLCYVHAWTESSAGRTEIRTASLRVEHHCDITIYINVHVSYIPSSMFFGIMFCVFTQTPSKRHQLQPCTYRKAVHKINTASSRTSIVEASPCGSIYLTSPTRLLHAEFARLRFGDPFASGLSPASIGVIAPATRAFSFAYHLLLSFRFLVIHS